MSGTLRTTAIPGASSAAASSFRALFLPAPEQVTSPDRRAPPSIT